MKFSAFSLAAGALALATFSLAGCSKDVAVPQTEFTLHMDNGVATTSTAGITTFNSLVLGTGAYKNANGDDFTVSTLRYYISNVTLKKGDGSSYAVPNSYFLVDQSNADTQDLTMTGVPVGDYTGISFVVGVDSARSKAGNFTGVLNADKGLLWTMNGVNEFINLELKGNSPQARTGALTFHIAGYIHSTTNTIRTVTVPFPSTNLLIRTDHSPEVHMQVDIAKMFSGPTKIKFADTYNVMGGAPAVQIANNIQAGMFTVSHIHAN
ncbi:MbnP family protein [Hymenobacter rubidus]|uniref:MbnP family protein n=1 Tax=Hymenobacter rubidus TaxID=1441626 RepID=UPI00191EE669|nr:MbnP family protein [Hymenobacter rubidus]